MTDPQKFMFVMSCYFWGLLPPHLHYSLVMLIKMICSNSQLKQLAKSVRTGKVELSQCFIDKQKMYFLHTRSGFLAHQLGISEILPWAGKFYLTHAILPRLSGEGFIHLLYWNSRTLSSSDVIVMLK